MKTVFSFAHPDDETFFCGGYIAQLTKSEDEVKLICATKGEMGVTGDLPFVTRENLGIIREQELKNAAKILGISQIFFLGFRDGFLNKLLLEDFGEPILQILEKEKPDIVITFNKTGLSNHPDHRAISIATTKAFEKYLKIAKKQVKLYYALMPKGYLETMEKMGLKYEPFGKMKGDIDADVTKTIDIEDVYYIKTQAAKCHKTQYQDWKMFETVMSKMPSKREFLQLAMEN